MRFNFNSTDEVLKTLGTDKLSKIQSFLLNKLGPESTTPGVRMIHDDLAEFFTHKIKAEGDNAETFGEGFELMYNLTTPNATTSAALDGLSSMAGESLANTYYKLRKKNFFPIKTLPEKTRMPLDTKIELGLGTLGGLTGGAILKDQFTKTAEPTGMLAGYAGRAAGLAIGFEQWLPAIGLAAARGLYSGRKAFKANQLSQAVKTLELELAKPGLLRTFNGDKVNLAKQLQAIHPDPYYATQRLTGEIKAQQSLKNKAIGTTAGLGALVAYSQTKKDPINVSY